MKQEELVRFSNQVASQPLRVLLVLDDEQSQLK